MSNFGYIRVNTSGYVIASKVASDILANVVCEIRGTRFIYRNTDLEMR